MKILVINGPNLNMLGIREPDIYGKQTYEALVQQIAEHAAARGAEVSFFQSNHEGAIVDAIQQAYFDKVDGIVINPAAYTHTSVAILDALKAVAIPTVEVHISDIHSRGLRENDLRQRVRRLLRSHRLFAEVKTERRKPLFFVEGRRPVRRRSSSLYNR